MLRLAGELFQAPASSVRLIDAAGERLELAAHAGLGEAYCQRGPVPLGSSAAGRAASTGGTGARRRRRAATASYLKGELLAHEGLLPAAPAAARSAAGASVS